MKKVLFLSVLILASGLSIFAQNRLDRSQYMRESMRNSNIINLESHKGRDILLNNSPKATTELEPYKILNGALSVVENVTTGEYSYYKQKIDVNSSGYFDNITYTFLDDNLNDDFSFSIEPPALCDDAIMSPQHNSNYFMVYLKYFEGSPGPDNMRTELWIVQRNGTILDKFSSTSVGILFEGKLVVFPKSETIENGENVRILNATTFNEEKLFVQLDREYTNRLTAFTDFVEVNGQSYVIVPQYESLFFDEDNMEYFVENNHLILNFYSIEDYTKVKEVKIPLEEIVAFPDGWGDTEFGAITVEFGFFPHYGWDITTDKFNSDAKMEFIVGVNYELFTSGDAYVDYYVANEDGTILKTLREKLSSDFTNHTLALNDIEGYDDQVVFGQNTDEGMNLYIFNVNSWTPQAIIPAVGDDELQLSVNSYRQPIENGYKYVIASGTPTVVNEGAANEEWYGHVKEFSSDGVAIKTINLNLEKRPFRYTPILSSSLMLDPTLMHEDDEPDYAYYVSYSGEPSCFFITKADEDPFLKWTNNDEYGTLGNPGIILDLETDIAKWLQFQYTKNGATSIVTYEFPLVRVARVVENTVPANNATDVYRDTEVSVTFNKYVEELDFSGITIKDAANNVVAGVAATITNGITMKITHENLEAETQYTVTIPAGALNLYAEEISWTFTTGDDLDIPTSSTNIVEIYPNPSSGEVNINLTEKSIVRIFDVTGRIINTYNVNDDNSTLRFEQNAGIYFIEVEGNNSSSVHRLIIQ